MTRGPILPSATQGGLVRASAVLLAALLMAWPAFYNGYPAALPRHSGLHRTWSIHSACFYFWINSRTTMGFALLSTAWAFCLPLDGHGLADCCVELSSNRLSCLACSPVSRARKDRSYLSGSYLSAQPAHQHELVCLVCDAGYFRPGSLPMPLSGGIRP